MKISPVSGTTPISNAAATGLSPEKIARLKEIAAGKAPAELTAEPEKSERVPLSHGLPIIKMNVNRTTNRDDDLTQPDANNPPPSPEESTTPEPSESATPDNGVQANASPEATEPLSPQMAALAKQRRALQLKERELAEKMKALEGPTRAELEARIKAKPLSVLQELGVTYDQLTQEILAEQAQGAPPLDLEKFKADLTKTLTENLNQTLSEKEAQQEKAVLSEIRRNVIAMSSQGDDFEMIRETKSQEDVVDLIHRTWKETGEVLDEQEAMRLVEEELLRDAAKFAQLKKVQGKLTPPAAPAPAQAPQSGITTLTNKHQASPQLSRRQRAIAAMQGTLKR